MFNPGPLNRKQAEFLNGIAAQRPVALPQSSFGANPTDWRGGQYNDNIVPSRIFPAKLTAVSGGLYSWTEQTATGADYSGWVDLPGGESGTNTINPAYEPNDVAIDVSGEPVVFLMREYLDETLDWVYVMVGGSGGGAGVIVENSNNSVIVDPTDTFKFSAAFTVADLGNDTAFIDLANGSNGSFLVTDGTHNCSDPGTLLMNGTYFIVGCANGVASVIPKVKTVSLITGCNNDGSPSFGNFVVFDA